jgi:hypothetical protein
VPVDISPGMTVKEILAAAGHLEKIESGMQPYDQWGNELGLESPLAPGTKVYLKKKGGGKDMLSEIELPNPEELAAITGRRFTRRVALTTAIYAVILAISALGGNHAAKHMLLAQQKASDQWAFYQGKDIRRHMYGLEKRRLAAEKKWRPREAQQEYEAFEREMAADEQKYDQERFIIMKKARDHEMERDRYSAMDPYFDYADALLQIAIVMSSIAILAHSRSMYIFSLVVAGLGIILTINGFSLVFYLPFLPH